MTRDPIVEEVRRTRYQISSKYGTHEEYCRHLRSIQKKYAGRLVRRQPALRR